MRFIHGVTGCKIGRGSAEIETDTEISLRIVDCADAHVSIRVGTHPESARLTPEEAYVVSRLLVEAADRAKTRTTEAVTE